MDEAVRSLSISRFCFVVLVITTCLITCSADLYAHAIRRVPSSSMMEGRYVYLNGMQVPLVVFANTIEDFIETPASMTQQRCEIRGQIRGKMGLSNRVGVHSNDYRVVLYSAKVDQDGHFHVPDVLPGTYRITPLSDAGKLIFTPSMGHLIACGDGKNIEVHFSIRGRNQPSTRTKVINNSLVVGTLEQPVIQENVNEERSTLWSQHRRQKLLFPILRGQISLEETAQKYHLSVSQLQQWREEFLRKVEETSQHLK